ncbi:hypothetical protein [Arthrobacter woluwensis]|uniref:hypothetical protein n=1 Tax=Arthrobacter woluwensis TaxID=156980 RepID=UPI001114D9F6|nr:hypothetical protein [Arthrobacter woluwensis]
MTLYISGNVSTEQIVAHREAAIAASALLLFITGPLAGVSAAIEAGRERRSRGLAETKTRTDLHVLWVRIWPSIVSASIVQLFAIAYLLVRAGSAPDPISWWIPLALCSALVLHAVAGYVIGQWMPAALAIPATVLLSYLWVAFTWTVEPTQLRYMAGPAMAMCCSPAEKLDGQAPLTLLVFSLIMSVAYLGIAAIGGPRGLRQGASLVPRVATSVLIAAIAFGAGMFAGNGIGIMPGRTLAKSELRCSDGVPTVCLSDVQIARGDQRRLVAKTFSIFNDLGLQPVRQVEPVPALHKGDVLSPTGTALISMAPGMSELDTVHSAASTYSSQLDRFSCDLQDPVKWFETRYLVQAWFDQTAARALLSPEDQQSIVAFSLTDPATAPELKSDLADLTRMTKPQQTRWIRQASEELLQCKVPASPGSAGR